jgi:hypothetical protein
MAGHGSTCECKDFLHRGHQRPCKHLAALRQLVKEGKLEGPRAVQPVIVNALEPMARALLGGEMHRQMCCSCGRSIPNCICTI